MTHEELLSVAEIVERFTNRFHKQAADHEAKMDEHRAAFGVRTEADRQIIAGLREESAKYKAERDDLYQREGIEKKRRMDVEDERDGFLTQVQDMRAEIERLQWENKTMHKDAEDGYAEAIKVLGDPIGLSKERDALRAEVAALQERLRASIARGDFAQMELSALKSQTPKQHPVKVGEWVRRLVPSPACGMGTVAKVVHVDDDTSEIEYDVKRIDGQHGVWFAKNCEPCAPPTEATHAMPAGKKAAEAVRDDRKIAPKPGDTVRLVRIPSRDDVSSELKTELEWPWIERWGTLNQTALVVEPAYQLDGALSVCLSTAVHVRWPISCIEVITEATHDTEAGKAAAEAVVRDDRKTEPKPGDTVRLMRVPTPEEWLHEDAHREWEESFGQAGDIATVLKEDDDQCSRCVGVRLANMKLTDWPMSCVEVVRTEPDEIKVGDLVEVISRSFPTFATIGTRGKAIIIHGLAGYVDLDNSMRACIKDVRKVTT